MTNQSLSTYSRIDILTRPHEYYRFKQQNGHFTETVSMLAINAGLMHPRPKLQEFFRTKP